MRMWLLLPILLVAGGLPVRGTIPLAVAASAPADCAALQLHLAPGLHPPSGNGGPRPAPDAPAGPFTVALPLYPRLTQLQQSVGSPFSEVQDSPYLQTASAEYHTTAGSNAVSAWYTRTMRSCGWRSGGSWNGNSGAFPHGVDFDRGPNRNTTAYVGFADRPDGGTDVAIAVEAIRYPAPPPAARIHGPFVALHVAISRNNLSGSRETVRTTITDRGSIARMVGAIDAITSRYTVPTVCFGGLQTTGPAWLTFVRTNGAKVHAFESGPGACGGLAVNGVRWLVDGGTVWSQILQLASVKG